jgi:hypothetical protein
MNGRPCMPDGGQQKQLASDALEHTGNLEVRQLVILAGILPPLEAEQIDIEQIWVSL